VSEIAHPAHAAHRMPNATVTAVGIGNLVVGLFALVALVSTYGFTEHLMAAQDPDKPGALLTRAVTWWGPDFSLTLGMSLIVVGAASGLAGSMIQQSKIFAERAGHETLQRGFLWWYVLRPVWSILLGAVTVVAVNAGVIQIGNKSTSDTGLTVLVMAGVLAGLFTDQVLQVLRAALGATDPAIVIPAGAKA
jgi:hypothetical protein